MQKYFAILDFEATCDEKNSSMDIPDQEIIQFPIIVVAANSINHQKGKTIAEFNYYVKPIHKPLLTDFCTTLTAL